jgi:uncharacterized MnhB-related membrane protein
MNADLLHVLVPAALVLSALSVLFLRRLFHMAIALDVFSFLLALEFYILQAPDVAIAEAGIGAGLTTAILFIAIRGTRNRKGEGS